MKVLIIGATGYLGHKLFSVSSTSFSSLGTSTTQVSGLLQLHLDVPSEFDYEVIDPLDIAFVTAAISSPDVCAKENDYAWKVNVTGTSEFISRVMARGARVIFFSSDTVYGERDQEFDERSDCNAAGEYAEMKREVEMRFLGDPNFKSIRLSYVFSREDKFTKYLSERAARNEEAEIFHPFYRAVIHRDDVVQGALALTDRWDEFPQTVINFGGPQVLSRIEFAEILRDTALTDLRFTITEPDERFFLSRPRIIKMNSPSLESLLKRPARTLREAAQIEFN